MRQVASIPMLHRLFKRLEDSGLAPLLHGKGQKSFAIQGGGSA